MRSTFSGQQWHQREDSGIGATFERQWSQRMGSPSQTTHYVTEPSNSFERFIQASSAYGVIDDVETATACPLFHVGFDRSRPKIDRSDIHRMERICAAAAIGRKDFGT